MSYETLRHFADSWGLVLMFALFAVLVGWPFRKGAKARNEVDGNFRRLKWLIMIIALVVYYVTPWIRWDRGPYAPDQAVLIDLANRRLFMFNIEIWPHEFYYVAGLLIMAGIGLFLITSAVGRAWCGYACPQTVWTDLFQHVDRFIDGDRNAQMRLAKGPWNTEKIGKRALKYAIYLTIAFWTGGAWIMYFADAPTLVREFWTGQAAFVAYGTVFVLTMTTFVLGGFMREQVCVYMCPWPRIQTAMMDEKSLLVTYKDWRGEPRGSTKKSMAHPGAFGDCIDCNQCVAVCPTGIDIRTGPQIGCITCALCIDACDAVMKQVGRPRGLIDYCTLEDTDSEKKGGQDTPILQTLLRPRTIVYFGVWGAIGLAMLFTLGQRSRLDIAAQHDRNPVFVQLTVADLDGAAIWTSDGSADRSNAAQSMEVALAPDAVTKLRLFVAAPGQGEQRDDFTIRIIAADDAQTMDEEAVVFERPAQ